jgi:hypothetical protein
MTLFRRLRKKEGASHQFEHYYLSKAGHVLVLGDFR